MVRKMGRPTNNPKIHQTRIRMSDVELQRLNYCSETLGISKTDVINKGVEKVYRELIEK